MAADTVGTPVARSLSRMAGRRLVSLWACAGALALAPLALGCAPGESSIPVGQTTTPIRGGLIITPPEGPVGTLFTLMGSGLTAGDAAAFEISCPGEGKAFPGTAVPVGSDGTVSVTYRATSANPFGPYAVKLTSARGVLAEATFTITDGEPVGPSSSVSSDSSTTKSPRKPTTTKAPAASSTTVSGQTTTSKPPVTRTSSSTTSSSP